MIIDQIDKPQLDEALLVHYGVKGMHWGVVNKDQPSSGNSAKPALSARKERRVAKYESRAEVLNTKIADLKLESEALQGTRNPLKLYERYAINQSIKSDVKVRDRALKDAEAVKQGKLTSGQKKIIIGAVAVAAVLAAGAAYQGHQSGALNSMSLRGKAFLQGQEVPFRTNEHLASKNLSAHELLTHVAKPVNPGYSKSGGKMNCRRSTYAYELRRRGFDVHATTSSHGWGQSESGVINAVTPGSKKFYRSLSVTESIQRSESAYVSKAAGSTTGIVDTAMRRSAVAPGDKRSSPITKTIVEGLRVGRANTMEDFERGLTVAQSSSKAVLEKLAQQPNGARGEVLFNFGTFGHSMAYEVVHGVPHIFDSQKGTLYNASNLVEGKWDGFHTAEITRLDNVNLDLGFLSRWATNTGSNK